MPSQPPPPPTPPQKKKKKPEEFFTSANLSTCEIAENDWVYKDRKMCVCVYFYLFISVNSFFRYVYLHLAKETIKRRETEKSNESKQIG